MRPTLNVARCPLTAIALALALGAVGCGGGDGSADVDTAASAGTSPSAVATSAAPQANDDGAGTPSERLCKLVSPDEAAAALGTPVEDGAGKVTEAQGLGLSGNCSYKAKSFSAQTPTILQIVLVGTKVPRAGYDEIVKSDDPDDKVTPVPGLGEVARSRDFGSGGAGLVVVYDRGLVLTLSGQKAGGLTTDVLIELTRKALGRADSLR